MAKLTVKELECLTPADIGSHIRDDGSLRGTVRRSQQSKTGVSVTFVYRFSWEKTYPDFPCGTWPSDSLAAIRSHRDTARLLVKSGINPIQQKKFDAHEQQNITATKLVKIEQDKIRDKTFEQMFEAWLQDGVRREDGNKELRRSFNKEVLPHIGNIPVRAVTEHDLRTILRALAARGINRTTVIAYKNLMQMFSWAEDRQPWRKLLSEGNPVKLIDIEKIVSPDYDMDNQRTRILSPAEICELRDKFAGMRREFDLAENRRIVSRPVQRTTEIAIWIMLSTVCRVGELSKARWERVDFERREWFIPRLDVKGKVADLTVLLSDFALMQFRQLHEITGHTAWCFPASNKEDCHVNEKTISKQVGDRQSMFKKDRDGKPRKQMQNRTKNSNALVLSGGKNGDWTPNDLRRTGATMMQGLGIPLTTIDRCQNHVLEGSKVRRHYLHHEYWEEKCTAWRLLGEKLSQILDVGLRANLSRKELCTT